jgi:hypothetical protein
MDYTKFLSNDDSEHIKNYKIKQYSIINDYCKNEYFLPKNAHLKCVTLGSVGNISYIVHHLYFFKGYCEKIYVDYYYKDDYWKDDYNNKELFNWNYNPYDKIFNQKLTNDYEIIRCWGTSLFDYDSIILDDIRKKTQHYFKFNENLMKIVNKISLEKNINEKTLALHIRLNDFNFVHGAEYGYVYYEDYIKEIDKILNKNDINNIFVGSDNYETLEKLKVRYGNKLEFIDNISRNLKEYQDNTDVILQNFRNRLIGEYNFITPFIDFLLLIKCGYFIGRKYSNFSSAVTFLGNMKFENIINLPTNYNGIFMQDGIKNN